MGGKGQKRRQKNFTSSHGGDTRLPPPPKAKEIDAIPSKLRRILELQAGPRPRPSQRSGDSNGRGEIRKKRGDKQQDKETTNPVGDSGRKVDKDDPESNVATSEKRSKKRKAFSDPHIQKLMLGDNLTKRQRKKEYLNARKKKHKKPRDDDIRQFPGHEDIKFGEIVDAPPKLSIPKALKMKDASKERLRVQAIEAYRKRRSWTSRPGINLPSITETSS